MGRIHKAMRRAAGETTQVPSRDAHGLGLEAAMAEFGLDESQLEVTADHEPDPVAVVSPPVAAPEPETRIDPTVAEKIVLDERMPPESREQYRRLASALHRAQESDGLKVVMIASAAAGEGKTLTACNLALTLSESYRRRVLLIDADLRRPALHRVFGLEGTIGLAEGLTTESRGPMELQTVSPNLSVLPAGTPKVDPMASLTSPRMRRVLDEARASFDWVIVDTPPMGLMTDAHLLATMVDGTVLVIKAGATPYDLVQRVKDDLGDDTRLLGAVLNRSTVPSSRQQYGYGGYGRYYAVQDTGDPSA